MNRFNLSSTVCVCVLVCVCVGTESGGVRRSVDSASGAADDQIRAQCFSFIRRHHHVLLCDVQLQLRQVGHFLT